MWYYNIKKILLYPMWPVQGLFLPVNASLMGETPATADHFHTIKFPLRRDNCMMVVFLFLFFLFPPVNLNLSTFKEFSFSSFLSFHLEVRTHT